ncbi:mannose-1-phosphate guanylyltransferase/mannose-6-phosphate isomerase [Stenotrophomonas maltophilia]|uniref:mannose-1-phosphate guanylyltransferase/mannose-6-phosphate isomerase n=1 Tax=Stenotrophomonas TaxID=40323 RepID=UPI0013105B76|nr:MULTISPECIES: mannose-1-phosphate guanylyltransferase/mannose-6-phosphate isomerase [Stenotrophomonas]ELC7323329.1 mannose-1-phosphate guanylyltransferase/mannose-6-phosphate isomerase [Stenotrophomonas maltophilia]MBA0276671.1 mannose-1-phosphate guanylyltransferase/mannose-6-phosphate isomerase [Stenotrophomonas maltophilia]MBA0413581.1 mannose-1-phosphate guanylyltransferase/mannose-6-phosphate isomerase [Stenotrophomonas maltophilia]MBA0498776.1 mannose-1-phosphate guanylyltransferase/ma
MTPIVPVILSGGSGTRLWPLSREAYPKQFLPLVGDDTMLQATWKRVASIAGAAPIVVANQEHRFMAAEQLRECKVMPQALILEPVGRNTAPAIAIAALQALANGDDALLLVLPSDHVVRNEAAFHAAVKQAAIAAEAGKLVTFGIVPTAPETGYGYIKAAAGDGVRAVDRFVEKPDLATAEQYVASGEYFWNSGMFLFKASRYLKELEALQPAILAACRQALDKAARDNDFIRLDAEAFAASPNDSIDYAVMEKTADAAVVPLDAEWNDVGSWSALWEVSDKDADGNACHGDVIALDCKNSYAYGNRLIAMVGLQDIVVVETDDAVFVGHKDRVQDVKEIVGQIKRDGRSEAAAHRKVYRPWGAYDSIDNGARFQVKRITVKPGATLSLQMHHHRAEHWIVVSGTAEVTRGDEVILLSENQSTYIPLGVTHRLKNPGKLPLELIEVQSGSYLGEDDIVRFEDQYGRAPQ